MIAETIRTHGYELIRNVVTNEYWVYNPNDDTMISLNTYLYNTYMQNTYPNYYNYHNYQCMYGIYCNNAYCNYQNYQCTYGIYCNNAYCNYYHPSFIPYNYGSNYSYYFS
jgi:hypothetical protein